MGLVREYKNFILKGNMLDLAVGFVIGAAFSTVVKSLVDNVIMPPVSMLMGGIDVSHLGWELKAAKLGEAGEVVTPAVVISYGAFINDVITLLIVGFVLFLFVRSYNRARERFELQEAEAPKSSPSEEVKILTEIRDELKKN